MKLEHAKIPPEFLTNIPEGMKLVHRGSEDFLVLTEVVCPNEPAAARGKGERLGRKTKV